MLVMGLVKAINDKRGEIGIGQQIVPTPHVRLVT